MLESFKLAELGVFLGIALGSVTVCLRTVIAQIEQSRCTTISCCCFSCRRNPTENLEIVQTENENNG